MIWEKMKSNFERHESKLLKWTGLVGNSALAAVAMSYAESSPPILVICPHESASLQIHQDLAYLFTLTDVKKRIYHFPARRTVRRFSEIEDADTVGGRLNVLYRLTHDPAHAVIVCSAEALSQYTLSRDRLNQHMGLLQSRTTYDRESVIRELLTSGYEQDIQVTEPGTFAVRGAILDIYSFNHPNPARIEFDGDHIESIRFFDLTSQRSLDAIDEFIWIPSREILYAAEDLPRIKAELKAFCDERSIPPRVRHELLEDLERFKFDAGVQSVSPMLTQERSTLLDFLPADHRVVLLDPYEVARHMEELEESYEALEAEQEAKNSIACPPKMHVLTFEEMNARISEGSRHEISDVIVNATEEGVRSFHGQGHEDLRQLIALSRRQANPLKGLQERIQTWREQGIHTAIVAQSESGLKRLEGLLKPYVSDLEVARQPLSLEDILSSSRLKLSMGELGHGFFLPEAQLSLVTEADLFGERKQATKVRKAADPAYLDLKELLPGDYVVHLDHGIGQYRGLERLKITQIEGDFLLIEYADKDKLFLPVYRLNCVHKYLGSEGKSPALNRLGNPQAWEKTKNSAKKAVEEMANELIELYAARQVAKRKPYQPVDQHYLAFEEDFPFEETYDQLRAIQDVAKDLESEKPMDRLICGDVGFGKTEVALRAAFRTVMEGMQAAILVPTTILAQQHYETFRKRMESHPISVDFVSRFKSPKEQKEVVEKLKEAKLDIVVGTHRLLSKDVSFKNLGLLILDEEHRFGVKHKEAIKKYRNQVHVLTLTATPIPRTLQLSMTGIRDLSIINTPPLDRKAVETVLSHFDDETIQMAIRKELSRQGQVFFVHNRVDTIDAMAAYLKRLVPELRIGIGHAQMSEGQLEETMLKFFRKEYDVLLCTTIIESGLDIPNANTMIINRADCFGLAQLYQLRGRVGRSDKHAYCYLLIPGEEIIGRDALKRLKTIKRFTELGSGLKIAMHDLEIRGGGNLLGVEQSGHIAEVGFEFYSQLLEREIKRRKGEAIEEEVEPEIQTSRPAFLPETYVPDAQERLVLYKRLSATRTKEELEAMKQELLDRFGKLPPSAENLVEVIELKVLARGLGISSLKLSGDVPLIEFSDRAKIDVDKLLAMVKANKGMKLSPNNQLTLEIPVQADAIEETRRVLENL